MLSPQLKWLLLPSVIRDHLLAKSDSDGVLPINLTNQVIERMREDPVATERLTLDALGIWAHLEADEPGWGVWPSNIEEALFVGILLGFRVAHEADKLILELTEDDLNFVEDHCRDVGVSLEQYLILRIIERIESKGDGTEQKNL